MHYVICLEENITAGQVTLIKPVSLASWTPAGYYCKKECYYLNINLVLDVLFFHKRYMFYVLSLTILCIHDRTRW